MTVVRQPLTILHIVMSHLTVQETRLEGREMGESHNIDIGQLPVEGVTSVCILLVDGV